MLEIRRILLSHARVDSKKPAALPVRQAHWERPVASLVSKAFRSGLCLLALAGCGGGGRSSPPAPPPAQSQAFLPFQAARTTVTYPVDSAAAALDTSKGIGANGIDASGAGSTVTVSTDANDHVSQLTISISTGGVNFSQTYVGSSQELSGSPTLGQLASAAQQVANAPPGTNGLIFGTVGNLSYSAFGAWLSNDGGGHFRMGVLAGGAQTTTMPTSGSATYTGTTFGFGANGTAAFALTGNAQISADFLKGTVTTTFSNLTTQDLNTNVTGTLPTQTGTGAISGSRYTTAIGGGSLSGTANGTFYGPSAQETAGVWKSAGGNITAMGSFGARQ